MVGVLEDPTLCIDDILSCIRAARSLILLANEAPEVTSPERAAFYSQSLEMLMSAEMIIRRLQKNVSIPAESRMLLDLAKRALTKASSRIEVFGVGQALMKAYREIEKSIARPPVVPMGPTLRAGSAG